MRWRVAFLTAISCAVLLLALSTTSFYPVPHGQDDFRKATAAIRDLSSSDPLERLQAKRRLVELWPSSGPPLLDTLAELTRNPYPRYPIGQEQEGARLLERHNRKIESAESEDAIESHELANLIITTRLRDDIISVIGDLRMTEAIPLLIEIMLDEQSLGATEQMNGAMIALKQIGEPAVPALIATLESVDKSPSAEMSPHYNIEAAETASARISIFRSRAAMVLGEIGDIRALPALESLQITADRFLHPYVDDALRAIRKKNGLTN